MMYRLLSYSFNWFLSVLLAVVPEALVYFVHNSNDFFFFRIAEVWSDPVFFQCARLCGVTHFPVEGRHAP